MRDIKFRAWSKKDKLMLSWSTIRQSAFNNSYDNPKDDFGLLYQILVTRKEDFDLMQYTGLKDKEGQEIYEGDIIEFRANYTNKPCGYLRGVLIYNVDYCKYYLKVGNNLYCVKEETDEWYYKREVIGNKYDNPELLEQ